MSVSFGRQYQKMEKFDWQANQEKRPARDASLLSEVLSIDPDSLPADESKSTAQMLAVLRKMGPHLLGEPRARSLRRSELERLLSGSLLPKSVGPKPRSDAARARWHVRLYQWLGRLDDEGRLRPYSSHVATAPVATEKAGFDWSPECITRLRRLGPYKPGECRADTTERAMMFRYLPSAATPLGLPPDGAKAPNLRADWMRRFWEWLAKPGS